MITIANIVVAVLSLLGWYLFLPALNLADPLFLLYIGCVGIVFVAVNFLIDSDSDFPLGGKIGLGLVVVPLVIAIIGGLASAPLFRAYNYSDVIERDIKTMSVDDYTPTIDNVPLMDRDTAELLASRTMGTLVEEVSQFSLGRSVQINYQGRPVRVVPLEYAGFFKWTNNRRDGVPAYIVVDMKTSQTEIVRLEKGMRYTVSGYFMDDLNRLLRFKFPTALLGTPVFEIDDEGNPFWITPIYRRTIGLFGGTDIYDIIVVDAISGDMDVYAVDEVPSWIDNVYPAKLVIKQYDWYGAYQDGFWNATFGQRGVIQTTKGYNYIPKDDDIYLYTGVTSVSNDESNIGFIFVNLRTKEYEYYEVPGAEEYSAMDSAQGVIQHLGYTSTFPLLLTIEGQPTYCVALKDAGGLVKMYGLVNMTQYQIVVTDETIQGCLKKYRTALLSNGQSVNETETFAHEGVVEDIRSANLDGTTVFYVKFEGDEHYYSFSVLTNEEIVLLNVGDGVQYSIESGEGKIVSAFLDAIEAKTVLAPATEE